MKRRWAGQQGMRVAGDESSSEVTSSSATLVMSPAHSLASTDIADVDLEFWDLDLNNPQGNHVRGMTIMQAGYPPGQTVINLHSKSDTSSISGKCVFVGFFWKR